MERIVFMGTPEFALASLEALHARGYGIAAVVTQPDRPKGRGNVLVPSPVKAFAVATGIPVLQPERAGEITEELRELSPDFIVTAAFGQILKRETLEIPSRACVNVHASLLPLYRGASPIHCAIVNGETETGVTTMIMDEGMDTGPILLQETVLIGANDTVETLHDRLAAAGAELLIRTLSDFDNITPRPQDDTMATCTTVLCKGHGVIDWSQPAEKIHNMVRGYYCWPSAATKHAGKRIIIWRTLPLEQHVPPGAGPGQVVRADAGGLAVATGGGLISILELQREGKKRQGFEEFLRGYPLKPGDLLGE